jgi:hypothetical protein
MPNPLFVPRVLWAALLASTVIIAALGVLLPVPSGVDALPFLPAVLGVVALVDAVVSFVLPARLLDQAIRANPPASGVEASAAEPAGFREPVPERRVVHMTDAALRALLPGFQTYVILGLALSESISLFGLVLTRVGADLRLALPFFGAGTILALVRVPSKATLFGAVERVTGATVVDETTP